MSPNVPLEALFEPGVFETLKVSKKKVLALDQHLGRLAASMRWASPSFRVDLGKIRRELLAEVKKKGFKEAYVRLTLVQGRKGETLSFILVKPPRKIPARFFREGVAIETSATRRNSLAALSGELKAREFHNGLLSVLDGLDRKGIFERIYLDRQGYVCEGTVTNLFILKGRDLTTPPSYLGALAGVTRSLVIALAKRQGLEVAEQPFTRFNLYNADEVFLTNTSLGILPVAKADGRLIQNGKMGSWTERLRKAYDREVR